jgi:hypothetical protein
MINTNFGDHIGFIERPEVEHACTFLGLGKLRSMDEASGANERGHSA